MRFKPSIKLTLLMAVLCLVFIRLGLWQSARQQEKQALFDQFESAPALALATALEQEQRFARIEATGSYDERSLLLDNRIYLGRAGVHVLTPLRIPGSSRAILVNRGWLPMPPDRRSLPQVAPAPGQQAIIGRLNLPPVEGVRLGEADALTAENWPQLLTYLEIESAAQALQLELEPWIIQLDARHPSGFEGRDWQPAVMTPEKHGGYAVQWFSLAVASILIWIVLGARKKS